MTYWSAPDLLKEGFPDPVCIVEKILMEGFTLFAGRPKTGKSWMALCLALSVALGVPALGSLKVTSGPVLYLALEDTPRRLQKRLRTLLGDLPAPPNLFLATAWPRGQAGADRLGKWAASQPGAALAIVDTLEKVRAKRSEKGNAYTEDYEAVSLLKEKADKYALGLLALTHEKKGGAEDMIEAATGSMGQAGTADQSWVLRRKRGAKVGKLFVTGRDIEEVTVSLEVDQNVAWRATEIDEGHDSWESSTAEKPTNLGWKDDDTGTICGWCVTASLNGYPRDDTGDMRLPNEDFLQTELNLSKRRLRAALAELIHDGHVVEKPVKNMKGYGRIFWVCNGE